MGLSDITIQAIAFRILTLLVLAGVHGGAVAGTAIFLGDKGPKYDGRLTVWPAKHVDFIGAICTVVFGWGWTKPIDVDTRQLRWGLTGIVMVVLAGFLGLLLTATLLDALVRPALTTLPFSAGLTTAAFLRDAASLSIRFALLSLVPVPPLAGGLLLSAIGIRIPRKAQWILVAVLFVAVATGLVRQILGPAEGVLASLILVQ